MPALEAEHRADVPTLDRAADGIGRRCPLELGIPSDDATRDVNLLELHARVTRLTGDSAVRLVGRVDAFTGNVNRPELPADVPGLEAREVGHAGGVASQVIALDVHRVSLVFANASRKIVVRVDDGLRGEDADRAGQVGVGGGAWLLGVRRRRDEKGKRGTRESRSHVGILGAQKPKSERRRAGRKGGPFRSALFGPPFSVRPFRSALFGPPFSVRPFRPALLHCAFTPPAY